MTPDSKLPNLATMKISAWHKQNDDEVYLNMPLINAEFTYASVLFDYTPINFHYDLIGGPAFPEFKLDPEIDNMFPDYLLYPQLDYSIGYTYKACPRNCNFCIVPKQSNDEKHYSIDTFYNKQFRKIAILNNNWLADYRWRETFQEIWDAGLILIDNNGFDVRLMTEESAKYIAKTKIQGQIHGAWDFMDHEIDVLRGIKHLLNAGIKADKISIYVLIGFNTTEQEDIYRIKLLNDLRVLPFLMAYTHKYKKTNKTFIRKINNRWIFKSLNFDGVKNYDDIIKQRAEISNIGDNLF